jgi:hypothetical protein
MSTQQLVEKERPVATAAQYKAQLAYGSRRDVKYPPERLAELRREYHAARLAENARCAIKAAGPLSPEQAQELKHLITETTKETHHD